MGQISVSLPSDGDTIESSDYNTPINTIVNEINGGLDNSNIASDAAIAGTKLADAGVTASKIDFSTFSEHDTWDSGWLTPTFSSNYDGGGSTVEYRKVGDIVYLRGQATRDSGTPQNSELMFTLPEGYRPTNTGGIPQIAAGSSSNSGKVHIQESGEVTVANAPAGGAYLLLNNFHFFVT